ncbi:MAG: energy-coupling factor transporter ATPase [Chloroflexi bacterium]|nr:energy-coupling factor transporter ATPase [Chloroflexota bacterium]
MEAIIRIEHLHHTYQPESSQPVQALRDVNLTIGKGEYIAILGHNGSGKSTLARHLNGLLLPTQGDVWIKTWNTKVRAQMRDIRATVGMVFQVPDNQLVATIVEEDVAFGPENFGVPHAELVRRVDWALEQVNMLPFRHRAPHLLSGGQKQRICIAGVLAMQPAVLVLDEATAMLDPLGRQEVLQTAKRLNQEQGVTVVAITHFMHEAIQADRIVVMAEGQVVLENTPRALFQQVDKLRALHLDVPQVTELALALQQQFPDFPSDLLSVEEMVAAVQQNLARNSRLSSTIVQEPAQQPPSAQAVITVRNLGHDYMRGTPLAVKAIHDVNLDIYKNEIVGIIGHTGSGKSTVVQHFNALMRAHEGSVIVLGENLGNPKLDVQTIRRRVGLVFQMPEAQLFEQYVGDDVAYGPRNLKLSREEVRARVRKAMEAVGLGFEAFKDRLTFSLSGGQMRRVALAGVLALEPEILVLDEPTAGLDPEGRRQLLDHILALHQQGVTLVIISHNMAELATVCDRLYVIADGQTVMAGTPGEIFGQPDKLHTLGLGVPDVTAVIDALVKAEWLAPGATVYTLEQAIARLSAC